jgi:hypothetical protein
MGRSLRRFATVALIVATAASAALLGTPKASADVICGSFGPAYRNVGTKIGPWNAYYSFWNTYSPARAYTAVRLDSSGGITYTHELPSGGLWSFSNGTDAYRQTGLALWYSNYTTMYMEMRSHTTC